MNLKARCMHLVVAALFLWSLGASGICEARCLEAAFAAATPTERGAGSGHAESQPSCHDSAPVAPVQRTGALDPSASGGEPGCHCVHTDEALLQPRADSGRPDLVFAAFALPARAVLADAHLQWRPALSGPGVTPAPHQHRNPPLLI